MVGTLLPMYGVEPSLKTACLVYTWISCSRFAFVLGEADKEHVNISSCIPHPEDCTQSDDQKMLNNKHFQMVNSAVLVPANL